MAKTVQPIDVRDVAARPGEYYRERYVWQWPVRIFHWVNALCITVLFLTGLYISHPLLIDIGEPFKHFFMARVREVHFAFAFLFFVNFVWRIYWFYMGNNYARSGFPFVWRKVWWRDLVRQVGDYLRFKRGHVHLGHNALAGLSYTIFVIALGWAQIFTGFGLYSESNPSGWMGHAFGWTISLAGSAFALRMWHHLFAWIFIVFGILHVYIVFYDGNVFENGLISSMVSGTKFYKEGDLDHDTWLS